MLEHDPATGRILPHEPTERTRVEVKALGSFGIPQVEIAKYIGIDVKTLRKYYRQELDKAHIEAHVAVGQFLYRNATGKTLQDGASYADCVRAAMFWAKTRMGWRETHNLEHSSPDGSMTPQVIRIVAADDRRSDD